MPRSIQFCELLARTLGAGLSRASSHLRVTWSLCANDGKRFELTSTYAASLGTSASTNRKNWVLCVPATVFCSIWHDKRRLAPPWQSAYRGKVCLLCSEEGFKYLRPVRRHTP